MRRRVFVAIATLATLVAALVATSISAAPPPVGYATSAAEYDLIAGQNTTVGKVYVWDWAGKVYVQFVTDEDWCITETHVAVGASEAAIPQTNKGNPIPGQFPAGETFSSCVGIAGPYVLDAPTGESWVVAAHAKVWDKTSDTCEAIVSNAGPSNPVSITDDYPDGWSPPANAVVVTPGYSGWPTISGASYISRTATGDQFNVNVWRKATETLNVPGWPLSGELWVNSDNYEFTKLNGTEIERDDGSPTSTVENTAPEVIVSPQTWATITNVPFTPVMGANAFEFVWRNIAWEGAAGFVDNPQGLIYKAEACYYADSDSAWGEGTRFVERGNWATYMEYTKGDGQVVFAQNDNNDIRMAFFVTDSPDAGPVGWIDFVGPGVPLDPTTFGQATGVANCYARTGTGPDFARFSGTNTPVTIGASTYTNFLFGVKEGGPTVGAARIRLGDATATNCVTPVGPMTNADINGDVSEGEISIYFP
jgi:hypothetical protein